MSHATWYARGLGDGAAEALGLRPEWTVLAMREARVTAHEYAAYVRARTEAAERTRRVVQRRRRDAQWQRDLAAFLAAHRVGQELRWLHTSPLRLVSAC